MKLLRTLADRTDSTDPGVSWNLRESAKFFESLAIEVHREADLENVDAANIRDTIDDGIYEIALDIPMILFQKETVLDLVINSNSDHFLDKCCEGAITAALYGDMHHYHMDNTPGMWKIISGILTFGIGPALYNDWVDWTIPPLSQALRRSLQKRTRPKGYPFTSNEKDKFKILDPPLEERPIAAFDGYWKSTFSWYERLYLFWNTPVVLFFADKMVSLAVTLCFTLWFVAHRQHMDHVVWIIPMETSPSLSETKELFDMEICLCVYFAASFVRYSVNFKRICKDQNES